MFFGYTLTIFIRTHRKHTRHPGEKSRMLNKCPEAGSQSINDPCHEIALEYLAVSFVR